MAALPYNSAYSMLNRLVVPKPKLPPNASYGMLNPGTTNPNYPGASPQAPGGTPPDQKQTPQVKNPSTPNLPYAGVYLEQQNQAQAAYEQAQNSLLAQRNTLYHSYGLTDSGEVDPYNQYGQYQSMLGREGADLDTARNDSIGRGIGTGGLANQSQSALRNNDALEQLGFKQMVLGTQNDYSNGLAAALAQRNSAFLSAEEQANQDALSALMAQGYWQQPGPSGDDGSGSGTDDKGGSTTPPPSKTPKPTVKAAQDALSRYLANQARDKKVNRYA